LKLIVGIDAGITNAIAILSINGDLLLVKSGKNLDRKTIVTEIIKYGIPVIVACDVAKPNNLVKKIASTFNARLVYPPKNLSIKKKRKLISDIDFLKINNSHERDALASAIFALKSFRKLFYKIDRYSPPEVKDIVKELILKHESPNIKEAIRSCCG
jgi:predicted RNase H-like nuclease (RuvC/YqgF family)